MTEQQAINWYWTEVKVEEDKLDRKCPPELRELPPTWMQLTHARRDEIRERVALVLSNEIPKSQMGPGDLAIFHGRYRMLEQRPPDYFMKEMQYGEAREMKRAVFWDCLQFCESVYGCVNPQNRLFGNANVGNFNLTNLQVAGQLTRDRSAYLNGWHLTTTTEPELLQDIERLFANAIATISVGDHPQASRRLVELWREPQPTEILIPARQGFRVNIDFFGENFRSFKEKVFSMQRDSERGPFRLWINLEGWLIKPIY